MHRADLEGRAGQCVQPDPWTPPGAGMGIRPCSKRKDLLALPVVRFQFALLMIWTWS